MEQKRRIVEFPEGRTRSDCEVARHPQPPNDLIANYREMASDSDREREAIEWSEGLIDDAFTP